MLQNRKKNDMITWNYGVISLLFGVGGIRVEILAYCGVHCTECPIFIATKQQKEIEPSQKKKKSNIATSLFSVEDAKCYGCVSNKSDVGDLCAQCEIRICARHKKVENCGYCQEYPCELTEQYIPENLKNRKRLDEIAQQEATVAPGGKITTDA